MTLVKNKFPKQKGDEEIIRDIFPFSHFDCLLFTLDVVSIDEIFDSVAPQQDDGRVIKNYERDGGTFDQLLAHRAYISSRNALDFYVWKKHLDSSTRFPPGFEIKYSLIELHHSASGSDEYISLQQELNLRREELLSSLGKL